MWQIFTVSHNVCADTGDGLNYQSIGSGAGIKQIRAKTVTFGATDATLEPKELDKDGLAQWPMVMGGIVMVVNIPGVKPGELVLDGPTVAQIYLGKIANWNDPAVKKLNPGVNLPNLKWAYEKGDKMAQDLDNIPMPDNVVKLVEAM